MRRHLLSLLAALALALFVSVPLALADDAPAPAPEAGAVAAGDEAPGVPSPSDTDAATTGEPAPIDAPAGAGEQPARSADEQTPAEGEAPQPRAAALTIGVNDSLVIYGTTVTLSGDLSPAAAGAMVVEHVATAGGWATVATSSTDAAGHWSVTYKPLRGETLRARMSDNSATSGAIKVAVMPTFVVSKVPSAPAFSGAHLKARVLPATYSGKITLKVKYKGHFRGRITKRAKHGKLDVTVPNIGIGKLPVVVTLPAASGMHARTSGTFVRATTRSLSVGSNGGDVRGLVKRLRALNFHTPSYSNHYDVRVGDVVLAFHKAHRMRRSTNVDHATWDKIATASPQRAHYRSKVTHIEVDKTRQILSVVKHGKVVGVIHVSTGATGNTPVGKFHIYQKGGSHLYKFMAFFGNFGIHGYVPVPAFPASHGCVREPMWAAAWTFSNAKYGTPVYVYT